MKNSIIISSGLIILGICIIISSIILSKSLNELTSQTHIVNGSLGVNQSISSQTKSEYMAIGEISRLLGYEIIDEFTKDLYDNKLGNLPYVYINERPIFSRTAFEEWLVNMAKQ